MITRCECSMAQALRKKASVSGTRGQGGDNADKIAERTPLSCILIGSEAQEYIRRCPSSGS